MAVDTLKDIFLWGGIKMNTENLKISQYIESLDLNSIKFHGFNRTKSSCVWFPNKHSHNYFEFIYFFNAKAEIDVPETKLNLVPYDLVVYPPGVMHQEFPDLKHPQEIICIAAYIDSPYTLNTAFQISDKSGVIGWLFEQSFNEFKEKKEGYEDIIEIYLKTILLHINRYFKFNKSEVIDILNASIIFIHEHFNEDISVKQLANISCVSKSYISRIFVKKLGVSPIKYLNSIRIDAAKRLLLDSELSVNEISLRVGFNDSLYFSRVFKKLTGVSPTAFRNSNK